MDVPAGIRIRMIHGVAEFIPEGTATFIQAAIVPATATDNSFDDFSQIVHFTNNSNNGIIAPLPMKYYCGSATKMFEVHCTWLVCWYHSNCLSCYRICHCYESCTCRLTKKKSVQ